MLDKISLIYQILGNALYSYELFKRLTPFFPKKEAIFDPYEVEFWRNISDNSIQMAAIQWNKVFGSIESNKNNQNTHYTNLLSAEEFNFRLMGKGIDFSSTILDMKTFRDKYVAHKDKEEFAVPYFYRPIKVIHEFDFMVREKNEDIRECDCLDLERFHEAYKLRIEDYLIKMKILSADDIDDSELV